LFLVRSPDDLVLKSHHVTAGDLLDIDTPPDRRHILLQVALIFFVGADLLLLPAILDESVKQIINRWRSLGFEFGVLVEPARVN
jgi:hypothetical protein